MSGHHSFDKLRAEFSDERKERIAKKTAQLRPLFVIPRKRGISLFASQRFLVSLGMTQLSSEVGNKVSLSEQIPEEPMN